MIRALVLGLRFLAEICAIVSFVSWGLDVSIVVAVVAPLVAILVWARFMAPKSSHRLADPARLIAELVYFGLAIAAAAESERIGLAVAFAVVAIATALAVRYTGEPEPGAFPAA